MPCYRPMVGVYDPVEKKIKILPGRSTGERLDPTEVSIPCGQCIGCRLDRSRQWADRMMIELDHSKTAVFLTLTYSPENVPLGMITENDIPIYSLDKRHVQLFLKRLRFYFQDREIRFYCAGEYGDKTARPHYHLIVFGLSLSDFPDARLLFKNELGDPVYVSDLLSERLWKNGQCSIANVSWRTCAYVARYCLKKQTGQNAIFYAEHNIEPEFATMSRRPGLAGYFWEDHPDAKDDYFHFLGDQHRGKCTTPKFLLKKGSLLFGDVWYNSIVSSRRRFADDRQLLELQKTDLGLVDYLEVKEKSQICALARLKKNKI